MDDLPNGEINEISPIGSVTRYGDRVANLYALSTIGKKILLDF